MLVSILIFFIIFGILVISHEGGHFLIARANGITVHEFTIGMGPVLYHKKLGETDFSIRLLPFGGACIFDDMDGLEQEKEEEGEKEKDPHAFRNAGVWARIATVLAGPFFNVLLAFLLSLIVTRFSVWVFPTIASVAEDSAAIEAGLQVGDEIISMNGEKVHQANEVSYISMMNTDGSALHIVYERDGERQETVLTPKWSEEDQRYYMGINIGRTGYITGAKIIPYAWYEIEYYLKATVKSVGMLFTGKLGADDLSGPVGMVKMVDDTYEEVKPYGLPSLILTMLELTILLSVNLGVMNLIPIPALDGGRLLLLLIEVVRGKPLPEEKEGIVTMIGAMALIALMIFVMFNDFARFFN